MRITITIDTQRQGVTTIRKRLTALARRYARPFNIAVIVAPALLFMATLAYANHKLAEGPAIVVDGDTLWVGAQEVRIHGIDAPETGQKCQLPKGTWDCSDAATAALQAVTQGKTVRCVGHEIDQYGRLIARCSTN